MAKYNEQDNDEYLLKYNLLDIDSHEELERAESFVFSIRATDKWTEKQLNELGSFGKTYSFSRSKEGMGIYHHIHYGDIHTKNFGIIDKKSELPTIVEGDSFELAKPGDIVIADASEDYKDLGKSVVISDMTDRKIIAGLHTFKFTPNEYLSSAYYLYYSQTSIFKEFSYKTGTGISVFGISKDNLGKMELSIPTYKEQQKIGNFFKSLDERIANQERNIAKVKALKAAYLTEMFPQEGETVPKRRFRGFEGEWERNILSDLTEYANGIGHERLVVSDGKYELVNLNSISIEGIFKPSGKFVDESSKLLEKKDLVMILSDVGHGDLLGRVALIPENDKYALNQRVASLRPNELINPLFLYFNINKNQKYFKFKGAGMSQLNISKEIVEEFVVCMPCKDEQQKIGAFFKNIDNQIATEESKLDKLKKMKEAYLEEMFV